MTDLAEFSDDSSAGSSALPLRLGLVGYGAGGRNFHAPYIQAAVGIEIAGVVTTDSLRRQQVEHDLPGVPVFDDLASLLRHEVDVVTITTPPATRRELTLQAIAAKVAVVADKPFAPDAAGGRELVAVAAEAGVPLAVFHNRRWDADIRTLAALVAAGEVGMVTHFESRMDQDGADTLDGGPSGGILRDLGSHLVDQSLWLFGEAESVMCSLDFSELEGGPTDCAFRIELRHKAGPLSHLSSTKVNCIDDRELRLYGTEGAYVAHSTDVQASAVIAGQRPVDLGDQWGFEPRSHWGTLYQPGRRRPIPSLPGRYQDYYSSLALALAGRGDLPVSGTEAVRTLEVLDAARVSQESGRPVIID